MKKLALFLVVLLTFSCFSFAGCSNSANSVTVSFAQESLQVVKRTVNKGERLATYDIPEPIQNDPNYIYYWEKFDNNNITEDIVVRAKKYTKGLVFDLSGGGYVVQTYIGEYPHVIVPDYYNGQPVVAINGRAFDEDALSSQDENGVWVDRYDPTTNATGNRIRIVELPSTIKSIGNVAFYENRLLEEIIIPDEVQELGYGVFFRCHSLKNITLPKKLKTLGRAVLDSTKITSLIIPDGTEEIADYSIAYNNRLEYVVLPVSINKLGKNAICYYGTSVKTKIYYKGTVADWMFIDINREETSAVNAVLSDEVYFYSESEPTESGNYWRYVDGQPQIWINL